MNIEMPGVNIPQEPEKIKEVNDRNEIVAEVFERYHKDLISKCISRLEKNNQYTSNNLESDAEEIVASIYQRLLTTENPIDLNRGKTQISWYLYAVLENALDVFLTSKKTQKRIPEEKQISIEETIGEDEEENMPLKLREFFIEKNNDKNDDKLRIIESALSQLEEKNLRMADIIRRRYELGETLEEIGKTYNLTKTRIEHIEKEAFGKIRKILKRKPLTKL
jgi:RNA polymerase sigma factor (sigma-70 family)